MQNKKILILSGSTRKESYNFKLCQEAFSQLNKDNHVTLLNLRKTPLPLYDGDYEQENPYPKGLNELKQHFIQSDVLIIASPEYNGGISGVLKNTIDWLSRSQEKKPDLSAFRKKTAILMSASPSRLGGVKSLLHLRLILSHIKMLVLPEQFCLANAYQAFDENQKLKDTKDLEHLTNVLMQETKSLI